MQETENTEKTSTEKKIEKKIEEIDAKSDTIAKALFPSFIGVPVCALLGWPLWAVCVWLGAQALVFLILRLIIAVGKSFDGLDL